MAEGSRSLSTPLNILGIVLAGGKSKRMGQDKKFLLYENAFWLDRAVNLLGRALGEKAHIFVSGTVDKNYYNAIPDLFPSQGPIMGLYSVLTSDSIRDINPDWVIVIPVDMPKMSESKIIQLLPNHVDDNCNIEIIKFENEQMPLAIKNSKSILLKLASVLEQTNSHRSFHQLISQCYVRTVKHEESIEFINFNYPSDLENL